jgi:hypothetical protein
MDSKRTAMDGDGRIDLIRRLGAWPGVHTQVQAFGFRLVPIKLEA